MKFRFVLLAFFNFALAGQSIAAEGFVKLPKAGFADSAYVRCNSTGNYGLGKAEAPNNVSNNTCSVSSQTLLTSPMNAPIEGFSMKGLLVRGIADKDAALATITDTIWRNKDNTECILGTHVEMLDVPLADGQYWEINDIVRAGFEGKDVEIAYFYKPQTEVEGGNVEMLFRAGRTYTSVKSDESQPLPGLKNTPSVKKGLSDSNAAAVSENWIDFTTDVSFKDPDGSAHDDLYVLYQIQM